jgi:phage baseplate assembly protein W
VPPELEFLGNGWSFPPAFIKASAGVAMTSGVLDIERSLQIIFTTALGERIMQPTFGCSLEDALFEPMNSSRITYTENLIRTAILFHEPRIDADTIAIRPDQPEGVFWVEIGYVVRGSNSRFNFVFPFYINEARG